MNLVRIFTYLVRHTDTKYSFSYQQRCSTKSLTNISAFASSALKTKQFQFFSGISRIVKKIILKNSPSIALQSTFENPKHPMTNIFNEN